MKKTALAAIAVILVFTLAKFSFAENDFEMKGTTTKSMGIRLRSKINEGEKYPFQATLIVSGLAIKFLLMYLYVRRRVPGS